MKNIMISFIFVAILAMFMHPTKASVLPTCTDGIDNNFNTLIDGADSEECTVVPDIIIPVPVPETTLELCTDGIDNDFNTLIDGADGSCDLVLTPAPVENTEALCTDGLDNNFNTLIDGTDPACAPFYPEAPASTTPPVVVNNGGGLSGQSGGVSGTSGTTITSGTPISATGTTSTTTITTFDTTGINLSCSNLFMNYMGYNKNSAKADVLRLQAFLNSELGINLTVDGKFGPRTLAAVKKFQSKYASSVLLPWDQAGLSVNLVNRPTGYVYKTTLRQLNLLVCPAANIPMPMLP